MVFFKVKELVSRLRAQRKLGLKMRRGDEGAGLYRKKR